MYAWCKAMGRCIAVECVGRDTVAVDACHNKDDM